MKPEKDSIESAFDRWKDGFRPDAGLSARVRLRAARGERNGRATVALWAANVFSRPSLAACFAAVFVLVGIGIGKLADFGGGLARGEDELTFSYRLSIDPLYRLQTMAGAQEFANRPIVSEWQGGEEAPVLLAGLGWLQGQLDLTEPQFKRVSELHERYEDAFADLFAELLESHRAYQGFDRKRMDSDVIDYFQLYDLLQRQKVLSDQSARLTKELLLQVEAIIEPEQRDRYRQLLNSLYAAFATSGGNPKDA